MVRVEARSPRFVHSLQVVVETLTGTGYGSDSPWDTHIANLFVMAMDLSTFLVLFVVFPYVFRPVLENAFSPSIPATIDAEDHVIVCGVPQLADQLVEELITRDVSVVVIAEDEAAALELRDEEISAIHGDPTSVDALTRAGAERARTVIVDMDGERAASAVLAVGSIAPDLRTIVVVDHLDHERQLRHAGADRVITPRNLVGRRLAERVRRGFDPTQSDTVPLGETISLLELTVTSNGPIAGQTVETVQAMEDVSVVGIWADGVFVGSPPEETKIKTETVVLLSGTDEALAELESETCQSRKEAPAVIVAGHGIVGSTVRRELESASLTCQVVDVNGGDEVDIVGDATTIETLERAGLTDADVLVVALPDDDATVLAVLATHSIAELDVITRMNTVENETKIRRAGADYVLGVETITGRLLVEDVLQEDVLGFDHQIRIVRIEGAQFAGDVLEATPIAETGCVVVGVERDGTFHRDPPEGFEVQSDDVLVVVGRDEEVGRVR
jgi:Trk K+ transport system NAD-binding subunit